MTGYQVWRADNDSGTFAQLGSDPLAAAAPSASTTPAWPTATDYVYRVLAVNDTGPSGDSDTHNKTTTPAAPTSFAAISISATLKSILSWTDSCPCDADIGSERDCRQQRSDRGSAIRWRTVPSAIRTRQSPPARRTPIASWRSTPAATPISPRPRSACHAAGDVAANLTTTSVNSGASITLNWTAATGATSYTVLKFDGSDYDEQLDHNDQHQLYQHRPG